MAVSMIVNMRNPVSGETETASLTYLNPELFPTSGEVSQETYQAADTVGRRICALTNNTYVDTIITRTESTTEILNA